MIPLMRMTLHWQMLKKRCYHQRHHCSKITHLSNTIMILFMIQIIHQQIILMLNCTITQLMIKMTIFSMLLLKMVMIVILVILLMTRTMCTMRAQVMIRKICLSFNTSINHDEVSLLLQGPILRGQQLNPCMYCSNFAFKPGCSRFCWTYQANDIYMGKLLDSKYNLILELSKVSSRVSLISRL